MKTLILLFLCSLAYADFDTTMVSYEYIIFVDSITKFSVPISSFAVGNKNISEANGQPFRQTTVLLPQMCTAYYQVWITTNAAKNNTFLNNVAIKRYYYITNRRCIVNINGVFHDVVTKLREYPKFLLEEIERKHP